MTTDVKVKSEGDLKLEKELELLSNAFKDNDDLLKLLRSVFFGEELTTTQKETIKTEFANPELREAIKRRTYGDITRKNMPIGWESDFWMGTAKQIVGQHQDTVMQMVMAKKIAKEEMFERAFAFLENPDGQPVDFSYTPQSLYSDPLQSRMIARDIYFQAIQTVLMALKGAANQKGENEKEKAARIAADSMR